MASLHVLQVTKMLTFCYKAWDGRKESTLFVTLVTLTDTSKELLAAWAQSKFT